MPVKMTPQRLLYTARISEVLRSVSRGLKVPKDPLNFGNQVDFLKSNVVLDNSWGSIFDIYFGGEFGSNFSYTKEDDSSIHGSHLYRRSKLAESPLEASKVILEELQTIIRSPIPIKGVWLQDYQSLSHESPTIILYLALAATNFLEAQEHAAALLWANEALTAFENMRYDLQKDEPQFDWQTSGHSPYFYIAGMTAFQTVALVLHRIGNTGASLGYTSRTLSLIGDFPLPWRRKDSDCLYLSSLAEFQALTILRHPDPALTSIIKAVDTAVHSYGSWRKVFLKKAGGLTARLAASVFTYDGHLYVLGGAKSLVEGPYFCDFWHLDLKKMDRWMRLPDFPFTDGTSGRVTEYKVAVSDHKAYLFTGSSYLPYFDLKKKAWSFLMTKFKPDQTVKASWPYSHKALIKYAMVCVDGRLYVFGGCQANRPAGCDLLLELDIKSRTWQRLCGTPYPVPASFKSPGPRTNSLSWVDRNHTKIFFAFGECDLASSQMIGNPEGIGLSYPYDDVWSWDIKKEGWTRERVVGNMPGPRTEVAGLYSSSLDKVVVFGGYSPICPCWNGEVTMPFSYFADTFIGDMAAKSDPAQTLGTGNAKQEAIPWKQVLTHGFPTYRAGGSLIEDTNSGKMYLFSGYVDVEFLPDFVQQGKIIKAFGDIWELKIDLAVGNFDVDKGHEGARTAQVGPWQRCFSCCSVGSWKKCGGSCNGQVFYCDKECAKEGWQEHKKVHHCSRIA